ncbi:MAG: type II toxin-antitoxin system RelB/DinJ family antitoxin [Lachnospiraceae bacterium]|nr:type II toxin-antitoxin system RelB/DinJ family antitoxin [Lachnospiraceae bacterium]
MAEQVLIQFRADKALKQEVTEIYEKLGMDLPTAFRMFMAKSKMVKGLPFEATLPEQVITRTEAKNAFYELRRQAADVPEMSLEEINAEISAVRAGRRK